MKLPTLEMFYVFTLNTLDTKIRQRYENDTRNVLFPNF